MNRRAHNATTASVAAGALLLLGLALGATTPQALSARATRTAQDAVVPTARAGDATSPRRHRQRLVMPYFSFSRS